MPLARIITACIGHGFYPTIPGTTIGTHYHCNDQNYKKIKFWKPLSPERYEGEAACEDNHNLHWPWFLSNAAQTWELGTTMGAHITQPLSLKPLRLHKF